MRRSFVALAAIVAPVALATDEAPLEMPACETLPPDAEFRHFTGYGVGASEVEALRLAREDAFELGRTSICSNPAWKRRCEQRVGMLAQLDEAAHYVRKGYPREQRWRACLTLQVERKYVDVEHQQIELRRDLRTAATELAVRHGRDPVRIEPPTWADSQCTVGAAGEVLIGELAGQLNASGIRVNESADTTRTIRLQLARIEDRLHMLVKHVAPDGTVETYRPIPFIPELFGLEGDVEASCRWDNELGLVDGHRAGTDGLRADVIVPGNTGEYCEGDRMEPRVVVDRPSRVRVFSVERDGTAYVIWPYSPSQDDRVERTLSLGESQVQRPKVGEERLVAVAIPAESSFGETAEWRACKWPFPFDHTAWPAGAAVGSVGFQVAPEGTEGCPTDVTLVAIPDLPVCGS